MKKLIPLIAIALAMALPVVASADAVIYYDYTTSTLLLEMVEDAINAAAIAFDMPAHKTAFLAGIQQLYDYRDAENWSACVTAADNLASAASEWIVDEDVSYNVNTVCTAVGDIYEYDTEDFSCCSMTPSDVQDIQDGLGDLCGIKIWIEIEWPHLEACDEKRGEHQEEACAHKLKITGGIEFTQ